jgi:hypothetical protein
MVIAGILVMATAGRAAGQIDTYHVFKLGPMPVRLPAALTNIAYLDVPSWQSYIVSAKTEIQNNGWDSQITCELLAVARDTGHVFAGDPVTVFVPAGQFAVAVMSLVTQNFPVENPPVQLRYRLRCGALGATGLTDFAIRQTRITAHRVSGAQITVQ